MSQKLFIALTVISMSFTMFITGCGSVSKYPAKIDLNLKEGVSSTYKSGFETTQFVKLDMAVKTRVKDQRNFKKVEVTYTQDIQTVNADSSALALITIKDVSVLIRDTEGVSFDFNSSKETDKAKPLSAVIGKSYTISISSDGMVKPVNVKEVRTLKITGSEANVVKSLFSDAAIIARHEIHLPKKDASTIKKGEGWSKVVWSHPKIMAKKSFEKTYVLDAVNGNVAKVTMAAYETDKVAEGVSSTQASQFGFMSGMFDTQEKYTGGMKIDVKSGEVLSWNEKCVATYVVTDPTSKNDKKEPASLTMGLTHIINLEKVD